MPPLAVVLGLLLFPVGQESRPQEDPAPRAVIISKVEPQYSEEARKACVEGAVFIGFTVNEEGEPVMLKVLKTDITFVESKKPAGQDFGLAGKAKEALSQWRFRPATKAGKAISSKIQIEMHFRMLAGCP